ncbi:hypothetical protein SGL43_01422 [Streptomyces globisporus]|uniref:Uncharacterized protein n=1 Tax=Streptomyces globisporus TaxID=1908 RepID=A0ABN8UZY3_STRGL|nr:hypothetical protein SGL43_01422 [Streptomyces globisporus]
MIRAGEQPDRADDRFIRTMGSRSRASSRTGGSDDRPDETTD